MPMMAFIGVRISWLMWARNSLLASVPDSAASRAWASAALLACNSAVRSRTRCSSCAASALISASARRRSVMSSPELSSPTMRPCSSCRSPLRHAKQRHSPCLVRASDSWCSMYGRAPLITSANSALAVTTSPAGRKVSNQLQPSSSASV